MVKMQSTTWRADCGCVTVYNADISLPESQRSIIYQTTLTTCLTHKKLSGGSLFNALTKEIRSREYFRQEAINALPDKLADVEIDDNGNEVNVLKDGIEFQHEFIDDGNDNSNRKLKVKFVPTMKRAMMEARAKGVKARSANQRAALLEGMKLSQDDIAKLKKIADDKYEIGITIERD